LHRNRLRIFDEALSCSSEIAALEPSSRRVVALAVWSLHMGLLLYFIRDESPGAAKTRALANRSLDLPSSALPLAPQLAPVFGTHVGAMLAHAGRRARSGLWRRTCTRSRVLPLEPDSRMNVTSDSLATSSPTTRRLARERASLESRVHALEAALACIEREAELALTEPGVAFLVTRRVATIARRAR
jgi:hypothetical protein